MHKLIAFFTLSLIIGVSRCEAQEPQKPHEVPLVLVHLNLTSSAFQNGTAIPKQFTCQGKNISPPLAWSGVPENTESLVLICEDPDAPGGIFTHWIMYNIPPTKHGLAKSIPNSATLPDDSRQGKNGAGKTGYMGPCPPAGKPHHYRFRLFGLDGSLDFTGNVERKDFITAMKGHITAMGELTGTYQRE
jgi:Raf kinase inhibitor-like YbhB/YbcL family protein